MSPFAALLFSLLAWSGSERPGSARVTPQDAPPPTYPQWSGALTLGATFTRGNTETETLNGTLNAQRRGEKDRWTFDAFSNYGTTPGAVSGDQEKTTSNHGGGAKYDFFASKKLYCFGNLSAKIDRIAGLDLRSIVGAGAGYQWFESETVKWGTEAGLSYVNENFDDDSPHGFLAGRLASNLSYQISKSASFEQVAEAYPSSQDSQDFIAKLDNRLKLNITGKWIAQIQYVLDFDGSVPDGKKEADHRVVLSVGWSFGP